MSALVDHDIVAFEPVAGVIYEKRPARGLDGQPVSGLFNAWIRLDNPSQFNSYTTDMVKGVIRAFRAASNARDVVAVVFTGVGRQGVLHRRQHQGICRILRRQSAGIPRLHAAVQRHGVGDPRLRQAGDLRASTACASAAARKSAWPAISPSPRTSRASARPGPKHGSAPIGGATDFLPLMVGAERAMESGMLCEPLSAHKAYRLGRRSSTSSRRLKVDGKFVANPLVETQRYLDEFGRIVHGEPLTGDALAAGKALMARGVVDLSLLDAKVEGAVRQAAGHLPRVPDQELRGAAQAENRRLESQQGKQQRLARPQHAGRGAHGVPRLQRGPEARSRD